MTALLNLMRLLRSAAAPSRRSERSRKVRPMMLADAEHLEADLVGELDLLDQVAQPLRRIEDTAARRSGVFFSKYKRQFP